MQTSAVKHEFKAEIKQLLNILVHSLYTSREIFLRELISNASDALDKLRFESTSGSQIYENGTPLEIKINFDENAHTLTIVDTGIGLSKEELVANIGTIAKSGSMEFLQKLQEDKQAANNIIGKFGVGFYSVFMVAKDVTITSKSFREDVPAVRWTSDGLGEYEIEELSEPVARGTQILINLKEDAYEFSTKYRLQEIIKKHSNFISFPIYLENEKVNTVTALWNQPKSQITKEQYDEFYKFLTYDSEEPADTIHISIDAPIQFNAVLFIPKKNNDFFGFNRENYGLDLYVRRVMIQHKNKDLLPEYLSFVHGIVDSEDLPLNISRETLQENVVFSKISTSVTSQVLSYLIKKAKDDPEKFAEFWNEHGKIFKMGYGDYANQEKYFQLLRFNASFSDDEKTLNSLDQYIEKIRPGQKEIYYVYGVNRTAVLSDPLLEIFKRKAIPVFYAYDPVDEFVLSSLRKYKDYEFHSVNKSDLSKLDEIEDSTENKNNLEPLSDEDQKLFGDLLGKIKEILGDRVLDVKESKRLTDSAVCLVLQDDSMSAFQKIMRLSNKNMGPEKKIFEVNRDCKLIRNLLTIFKNDSGSEYLQNMVIQLFEVALLSDGDLLDVHSLSKRLVSYFEDSSFWYLTK
jgi:molecular chaperone HtpG